MHVAKFDLVCKDWCNAEAGVIRTTAVHGLNLAKRSKGAKFLGKIGLIEYVRVVLFWVSSFGLYSYSGLISISISPGGRKLHSSRMSFDEPCKLQVLRVLQICPAVATAVCTIVMIFARAVVGEGP